MKLPYAHIDRLYARAKILSFVHARLGLDFLEVDRPAIHLIIYPDGRTNQPTPKAKQSNNGPAIKTIFDLQARRVEVHDGMALVNRAHYPVPACRQRSGRGDHLRAVQRSLPGPNRLLRYHRSAGQGPRPSTANWI